MLGNGERLRKDYEVLRNGCYGFYRSLGMVYLRSLPLKNYTLGGLFV